MVAWLTGTQHLHVLAVQRSLTFVRPCQAFHDGTFQCRVMFAISSTVVVSYGTCPDTGSKCGVKGTGRRQKCVSCKGIDGCGRHPVSICVSVEEGKKKLLFDSSKLGNRPPTGELIVPLTHLLLLQWPTLRSCGLQVAGQKIEWLYYTLLHIND